MASASGRDERVLDEFAKLQEDEASDAWDEFEPLRELFNDDGIDTRTDISDLQVVQIARARAIAEAFDISLLNEFCDNILRLSLSKDRKSRKEFVDAFKHARQEEDFNNLGVLGNMMNNLRGN